MYEATCHAALDYYFNVMTFITMLGAAGWLISMLLFIVLHYTIKSHDAFKKQARAVLRETGYFDE